MISLLRRQKYIGVSRPARALLCGCVLGCTIHLQAQAARFPVTPEQVSLAMQERDWPMSGVQIRLAATVTATSVQPSLKIDSVALRPGHEALLRMACRVHTECLPFFASAVWPVDAPMPNLLAKIENKTGSVSSSHTTNAVSAGTPESLAGSLSATNAPVSPVIRAGSSAMLLLEGTRIHIRLHVVFAQSGHVGDTVRVTTPDRKQVYLAEVLAPDLLKGEL